MRGTKQPPSHDPSKRWPTLTGIVRWSVSRLRPVFLEPRDDYWEIHDPEQLTVDDRRAFRRIRVVWWVSNVRYRGSITRRYR